MKKSIFTFVIALIFIGNTNAQELPKTEFKVELSAYNLDIKTGESKDVTVFLVRSKRYAKSAASLNVSSALPEGVTITFQPAEGMIESSKATITVSPATKAGNYTVILNGEMQSRRKAALLKLSVKSPDQSLSQRD